MKTRRLSIISLAGVILLIAALTLGVCMTAEVGAYGNSDVQLSKTDVTVNNITVDTSSMTEYDENIAANAPEGAVSIASAEDLKNFLNGSSSYGYLTQDISYDKETMGSNRTFASGRTLDGNGHTITLTATVSMATTYSFGLLVDYNNGTIKNIKFNYGATVSLENNSSYMQTNHVGLICGENNGVVENCDLYVTGSFSYTYKNGTVGNIGEERHKVFRIFFGGITGANNGIIKNVVSEYSGANISLTTSVCSTGGNYSLNGTAVFGGVSGRSISNSSEIRNVIAVSDSSTSITVSSNKADKTGIFGTTTEAGKSYREAAAVQCGNSDYSQATPGMVDNVIVAWQAPYNNLTVGGNISQNAVVHCGPNTNVTVLDTNFHTDHCGCGTSDNAGEHTISYGNFFALSHVSVNIGIKDGKQIITAKPEEGYALVSQNFTKYSDLNVEDKSSYDGVPSNGTTNLLDMAAEDGTYTIEIPAYQPCNLTDNTNTGNQYYWRLDYVAYKKVELGFSSQELVYTGQNYLDSILTYSYAGSSYALAANQVNLLNNGTAITQMVMPGEYNLSFGNIKENEKISYIDHENGIVAFVDNKITNVKIDYADIVRPSGIDGWLDKVNINFLLQNAVEGAADGYVYTVNGSLPKSVKGLNMSSAFDTPVDGRTYTVYLTKNGQKVSNPIEFTVKVDANAPVFGEISFDYPIEEYYSQNRITLKISDMASGINSVMMNNVAMDYDSASGTYSAKLANGTNRIEAKDNVGNVAVYEVEAKIDNVVPVFNPSIYYYDDAGIKQNYTGSVLATSTVYFDLSNNTFGNGGGTIYYALDDGEWQVLDGILAITESHDVKFKAISNTVDVSTGEHYSFETKNMNVNVQLKDIVITSDDIVIGGVDKYFDGTNEFKGTVSFTEESGLNGLGLTLNAVYADVNSGEVEIIINIESPSDKLRIINEISGIKGNILKKEITVTIDNVSKQYGQQNPALTYTSDMIEGFEENIEIITDAATDSVPADYAITVGNTEYRNYVVKSVVKGILTVDKFVIDRMVYDFTTITGLDTNNAKGVVVGFKKANGEYTQFEVKYGYSAVKDGEFVDCEGMTLAGYYKVTLALPEGMQEYYEIKSGLESFIVKVIDSSIFEAEVESGEDETLEYVENYAKDDTDKDNAVIVKDYSYINSPDYVIVLSIFCACLLAVIFSIGCGKVLVQKRRDNNRNKKA